MRNISESCLIKIVRGSLLLVVVLLIFCGNNMISEAKEKQVYDVSGYGWCEYVPEPYNLEKDAKGYVRGADLEDFGGNVDAYNRWCNSWSLKTVWMAPNGHMVKLCNYVAASMEEVAQLQMLPAGAGLGSYQDVYGAFGLEKEDTRAMAYWVYGNYIDVCLGTGQAQNLPAVTDAPSWAKIGTLDTIFGSAEMLAYDDKIASILSSMNNWGTVSENARGLYGIKYSDNHVSLAKIINQNNPKYFEVRLYEAGMNSFIKETYMNIQLYTMPPKEMTEVEWRALRDILKKLTPCGDAVCDDIYALMYTDVPIVQSFDAWYPRNGYAISMSDYNDPAYGYGCFEFKIKPLE